MMKSWLCPLLNCIKTGDTLTPTLPLLMLPTPTKPKLTAMEQLPQLTTPRLYAYPSKPTLTNIPAILQTMLWYEPTAIKTTFSRIFLNNLFNRGPTHPWRLSFLSHPQRWIHPTNDIVNILSQESFQTIMSDICKLVSFPVLQFETTVAKAHSFTDNPPAKPITTKTDILPINTTNGNCTTRTHTTLVNSLVVKAN